MTWSDPGKVDEYVDRIGRLAPRLAGEAALVELLPPTVQRVLDVGCGDGRLTALVLESRPAVEEAIAIDSSPAMLTHARGRFDDEPRVHVLAWDLADPITSLGEFDVRGT